MARARVLIVGSEQTRRELTGTVLFGSGTERLFTADAGAVLEIALTRRPNLILVDGACEGGAVALIHQLRADPRARQCSVVALARSSSRAEDEALCRAGANLVLSAPVDPSRSNPRLEQLLEVPTRRAVRLPVRFEFWSGVSVGGESVGVALNISTHGLLLETSEPIDVGTRVELDFALPHHEGELRALGHVVREAASGDRPRRGVEFLILHGDARQRIEAFSARH